MRMLADLRTSGKILTWIVVAVCAFMVFQANGASAVAHETVFVVDQSTKHNVNSHRCDGHPINPHSPHHRCEHNARLSSVVKVRFPTGSESDDTPNIDNTRPIVSFQLAGGAQLVGLWTDCMRGSVASRAPFWTTFAQTCSLLN